MQKSVIEYLKQTISRFPGNLPNAHKMANSVICLPMHHALTEEDLQKIISIIKQKT